MPSMSSISLFSVSLLYFFFLSSPAQCLACYAFHDDDDALCLLLHGDGGSLSLSIPLFKASLPCILSYYTLRFDDILVPVLNFGFWLLCLFSSTSTLLIRWCPTFFALVNNELRVSNLTHIILVPVLLSFFTCKLDMAFANVQRISELYPYIV